MRAKLSFARMYPAFCAMLLACAAAASVPLAPARAQDSQDEILITNVNIFNGTSGTLITGKDVVLKGNAVAKIIPAGSGGSILANGYDQVLAATRQQLFLGATQIKIAVTGGVSSFTDPLYVLEFTEEEIQAAVKAASDYGTYVMAHAHDSAGAIRALNNGVRSIEHGSALNEEAVKLMAEKGAVFVESFEVLAQLKPLYTDPIRKGKLDQAMEGSAKVAKWAKQYGVVMGFGTDLLFSAEGRKDELKDLGLRKDFFSSPEIMIQATGNGGKIVGMCGKRNPYGKLGVIEEGAMADVLIYSKNPLEDVSIVEDYENNLKVVIKDGNVYKNTL